MYDAADRPRAGRDARRARQARREGRLRVALGRRPRGLVPAHRQAPPGRDRPPDRRGLQADAPDRRRVPRDRGPWPRDGRGGALVTPMQGDVWWAETENYRRPVLVVTRSQAVPVLRWIVVAPITRRIREIPTEIRLGPEDG